MLRYLLDHTTHKCWVFIYLLGFSLKLLWRGVMHDISKYQWCEAKHFARVTRLLKSTKFGSEEYKAQLRSIRPAIDHHYAHNRHHPEYFLCYTATNQPEGGPLSKMNLVDIVEMLCDWKAAVKRNPGGSLRDSIEQGQQRFDYTYELKHILHNSRGKS